MLETFACEAQLCEALGPAYPASGMFDENITDRLPRDLDWFAANTAGDRPVLPDDRWVVTFRVLASGRHGHIIARQLCRAGQRTGPAVTLSDRVSCRRNDRLRTAAAEQRLLDAAVTDDGITRDDVHRLGDWLTTAS